MSKLLLLVLVPGLCFAQGLTTSPPGGGVGRTMLSLPFSTPGCYASGTGGVTITRASVGTYVDGAGTVQTCAAGELQVDSRGLVIEAAATNYVLNSTTHPKTTQATGALPTGQFRARHAGTGTMTLVAGTATVTGLSCSAVAAGTVCSGNVTVGGTLSITTTAGTTRAQVEAGTWTTSWIDTAGTPLLRNNDQVSVTLPALAGATKWCVSGTYSLNDGRAWNGDSMWTTGTGANTSYLGGYFGVFDSGNVQRYIGTFTPTTGTRRIVACDIAGALSVTIDGTNLGLANQGAGTGYVTTWPATLSLGYSAGTYLSGFVKGFKVCRGVLRASDCK